MTLASNFQFFVFAVLSTGKKFAFTMCQSDNKKISDQFIQAFEFRCFGNFHSRRSELVDAQYVDDALH